MRILAVIPACGGSATLPNRNIRVIHGKPMIYYVINNALNSKYVTDVIVTTNSKEIISIARQMGVMTRQRDESLSNSWTSVETVVHDVFEQIDISEYDYIVTMQSISPTLKAATLDKAFEKLLNENLDTLISVKNQAHFYWEVKDGEPRSIQPERVNRHLLPPFYVETGAFFITKPQFIKAQTRLGEKVGLYELSGDEAIDVNSFGDLKQAEQAMERQETAIYVNGNEAIGLGHVSRVIQVADELFTMPDIYYDKGQTDPEVFACSAYNFIPVDGETGFIEAVRQKNYGIIINDVLNTTETYMSSLRAHTPHSRIINFEDEGEGAKYSDAIINALYESATDSRVHAGSRYYILPKLFLIYEPVRINETVRNVIVTFGGADPQGYTEQTLELALHPECSHIQFYFILGKAKRNSEQIMKSAVRPNICVLKNVDNMPEIMSRCDAAVSSRGRTCFELAALGIPTLSIAQHSREEKHSFVCAENGFSCLHPGPTNEQLERAFRALVFSTRQEREECQRRMLRHDLRSGRQNIRDLINSI